MSKPLSLSFFVFCLFIVAGCESLPKAFSNDHPQIVAPPDKVSAVLADAADRASRSLETLAAVEAAKSQKASLAPVGDAPPELKRAMTINWVGPARQIGKTLANRAGYGFLTIGSPPPVPIVVAIDAENMPVIDILRDLGLQLGMRADIKVDSRRKIVELHYAPNTGVGG